MNEYWGHLLHYTNTSIQSDVCSLEFSLLSSSAMREDFEEPFCILRVDSSSCNQQSDWLKPVSFSNTFIFWSFQLPSSQDFLRYWSWKGLLPVQFWAPGRHSDCIPGCCLERQFWLDSPHAHTGEISQFAALHWSWAADLSKLLTSHVRDRVLEWLPSAHTADDRVWTGIHIWLPVQNSFPSPVTHLLIRSPHTYWMPTLCE